ncbi:cell wall hydrolase [Novosphingobium sp.]|uniref:cell wall hydrolase n=1 Tax=Novosphingobium sp. TaxID=1874826 RepID=UPI0025EE4F22|nr:cell wall hydrolase [Novosphingobium sp.]
MPLEIQYRPIALPAGARSTRRPVTIVVPGPVPIPAATAAEAEFDRLKAAVMAERAAPKASRPRPLALLQALARATSWRQRVAGIAVIGALGVTLGAIGWGSTGITPARAEVDVAGLEPFERAGQSFPGSAFYYLDPADTGLVAPRVAEKAWATQGDEAAQLAVNPLAQGFSAAGAGVPIARPLFVSGGEDHYRAVQCLTAAIYYEAASEPDAGQRAVAQVVLNRVSHPAFPKTVCGVVYQGSERAGCQFSFACDGSMARKPMAQFWDRARRVANDALAGNVFAPIGLSTHYHTGAVHPTWDQSMQLVDIIGAHRFYRWPGLAGRPSAFNANYRGGEPLAAPHAPVAGPALKFDVASDPIALAKAYEEGRLAALKQAAAGAQDAGSAAFGQAAAGSARRNAMSQFAPEIERRGGDALYRASNLPGTPAAAATDTALPEYRNSGRWIAQPGN